MSESPEPVTLWHYTDTAGAIGILQSNVLRATALSHVNDSAELTHGLSLAKTIAEEVLSVRSDPVQRMFLEDLLKHIDEIDLGDYFVACASAARDDLSQWRAYGRGGGYALGITANLSDGRAEWGVQHPYTESQDASLDYVLSPYGVWRKVLYDENRQREQLLELITNTPGGPSLNDSMSWFRWNLMNLVLSYKAPGFAAEREYRVVVQKSQAQNRLHFRNGAFGVTPYVELRAKDPTFRDPCRPHAALWVQRIPIMGVVVGPTGSSDAARSGMEQLLESLALNHVRVEGSSSTYRNS